MIFFTSTFKLCMYIFFFTSILVSLFEFTRDLYRFYTNTHDFSNLLSIHKSSSIFYWKLSNRLVPKFIDIYLDIIYYSKVDWLWVFIALIFFFPITMPLLFIIPKLYLFFMIFFMITYICKILYAIVFNIKIIITPIKFDIKYEFTIVDLMAYIILAINEWSYAILYHMIIVNKKIKLLDGIHVVFILLLGCSTWVVYTSLFPVNFVWMLVNDDIWKIKSYRIYHKIFMRKLKESIFNSFLDSYKYISIMNNSNKIIIENRKISVNGNSAKILFEYIKTNKNTIFDNIQNGKFVEVLIGGEYHTAYVDGRELSSDKFKAVIWTTSKHLHIGGEKFSTHCADSKYSRQNIVYSFLEKNTIIKHVQTPNIFNKNQLYDLNEYIGTQIRVALFLNTWSQNYILQQSSTYSAAIALYNHHPINKLYLSYGWVNWGHLINTNIEVSELNKRDEMRSLIEKNILKQSKIDNDVATVLSKLDNNDLNNIFTKWCMGSGNNDMLVLMKKKFIEITE